MQKPLSGKAGKLTPQKARDFGLIDFQYVGSASLRESPRANGFTNTDRKVRLGEAFFGVGQADVSENVAAALLDRNCLIHFLLPFLSL